MSNHDIQNDSDEKFVPLTDNNNNLSAVKVISSIVLLGLLIFCITTGVQYAGAYLSNDEQLGFKKEHQRYIKDSNENKILVTEETEEKMKAMMEGKKMEGEDMKTEEKKEEGKMDEKKMDEKKMEDKKTEEKKEEHHQGGHHN